MISKIGNFVKKAADILEIICVIGICMGGEAFVVTAITVWFFSQFWEVLFLIISIVWGISLVCVILFMVIGLFKYGGPPFSI